MDDVIDHTAEILCAALGQYQPPAPGRGWRPQQHQALIPWRSRLEAYNFGGGDAAVARGLFAGFCNRLTMNVQTTIPLQKKYSLGAEFGRSNLRPITSAQFGMRQCLAKFPSA
jgi:hypothetical protein